MHRYSFNCDGQLRFMTKWTKRLAFGYYGGKFSHLNWLMPLLPDSKSFCEPFAGSAVVALSREPAEIEIINDLDGDIINFFRVLREQPLNLIEKISLTPYSRAEFVNSILELKEYQDIRDYFNEPIGANHIERARSFFLRVVQARGNRAHSSPGSWSWSVRRSSRGMALAASKWLTRIDGLFDIVERLMTIQIECRDALEVIELYDNSDMLFYVDPPYVHSTREKERAYRKDLEMTDDQHRELANLLHCCAGKVAISNYDSMLYRELYEDWKMHRSPPTLAHTGRIKDLRFECLWTNF